MMFDFVKHRAAFAILSCALLGTSALAQSRETIDPNTGNYVPVPDKFDQDSPKMNPDADSPSRINHRLSPRNAPPSEAHVGGRISENTQAGQLSTLGGMSIYYPNLGSMEAPSYPDWWPK